MIRFATAVAAAVLVAGFAVVPAQAAPADPQLNPADAVVLPVEDAIGPIEGLVFPDANVDGSIIDDGNEVVLAADVFFAYNSADLNDRARTELATIVGRLADSGSQRLAVTGHTDSEGTDADNVDLSKRRAESVRAALAAGLPGVGITAAGRGEVEPFADNKTVEGRALNRRVTIQRD